MGLIFACCTDILISNFGCRCDINIEKIREKMRDLTKQIIQMYSATKSYPYILEGLCSKNNRTRIECVDLVGFFIDHRGIEVRGLDFLSLKHSFF